MDTLYVASHWDELKLFVYEVDAGEYLMETFGMTKEEARETMNEMKAEFDECIAMGDYCSAEEVMLEYGFEMDYIFDMI